jgi:hypothetical protein
MTSTATATKPAPAAQPANALPPAPPSAASAEQPRPTPQFFVSLPFPRWHIINASENSSFGNRFGMVLPTSMALEAALEPKFYANVVNEKIRAGDTVEVHNDDLSIYAELYIRRVIGFRTNSPGLDVVELRRVELGPQRLSKKAIPHVIAERGPHLKWCVLRTSDGEPVSTGHESPQAATIAMHNLERK